ncbi:hypothetical protein KKB18_08525, partial [bacterium]|nr:hypothetical protein [bacterium]
MYRRKVSFLITLIVLASAFSLWADTITVDYHFTDPVTRYNPDGTTDIMMEDTLTTCNVGEPLLPMRTAKILIARNEKVKNIKIIKEGETILPGEYFVNYVRKPIPMSANYQIEKYIADAEPELIED